MWARRVVAAAASSVRPPVSTLRRSGSAQASALRLTTASPRSFSSRAVATAEDDESGSGKPRTSSSRGFNLLQTANAQDASDDSSSSNGNGHHGSDSVAEADGEPWRHRPQNYAVVRPKNRKWWKNMDRVSFRKLLEECVATGKVSSVLRKYMDEYPIMNTAWDAQELVLITGALIKMNRSELALDLLKNQINQPDRNKLNRVAAESARLGNASVALGVLNIVKHLDMKPDVITYTSAIHACARGARNDVPMALQLLNQMIEDGVEPNHRTYGAVVLAYARMNRWEDIEDLMESITYTDEAHKSDIFASAIITCTRNRQYQFATRIFLMLLDQGVYPGDKLCNAALSACARTQDLYHLNVIFKLIEKHATPTMYTYNSMISAYGNALEVEKALEVFEQMRSRAVAPTAITFNALLLAAVRSRRVELVPYILDNMKDEGIKWDVYTLNSLLEACVLTGDSEKAEEYWAQAVDPKMHNVRLDRTHFETLMNVYFAGKDFDKVVELWQKNYTCRRRAKSSKTFNFLIRACKENGGDCATAEALMEEFAKRGHVASAVTHNHMLSTYLAAGKYTEARAHLRHMMESEGLASTFSFTSLMKYLGKTEDQEEQILDLFDLYLDARANRPKWSNPLLHFPADALYVLAIRAALALDEHDQILSIYNECPESVSIAVKQEMLRFAIESCDKKGDWKSAVSLYDEITSELEETTNVELYNQVVKIVARAGAFENALDVNGGEWYRQNRHDKGW